MLLILAALMGVATADSLTAELRTRAFQAITHENPLLSMDQLQFIQLVERRCGGYSPFTKTIGCFTEISAYVVESAKVEKVIDADGKCHLDIYHQLGFIVYLNDRGDFIVSQVHGHMYSACDLEV